MRLAALFDPRGRTREAQLAHALRSVPLFQDIPAADLASVWRCVRELRLPAGAVVFERGDPGDRFFVMQSGAGEVRLGLGAEGVTIRRVNPGDFFGEMALVTGAPRSADVVVVEDTVLWVLEARDFAALTAASVPLLRALNRFLCDRVALMTLQIEDLEARSGGRGGGVAGMRVGPYRVIEQIGAGGMAVVFSAVHTATETAAAIKLLPAAWVAAGDFRERLEREAAVLQRLRHPNIVRVLDVGTVGASSGGGLYVAMELLPHALDRVLRAQYPEPLAADVALAVARQIADALAVVHVEGIVHRDVKPSNILLRADGAPVLTDFGLVMGHSQARLTATNVLVGTADYMSPELILRGAVDGRSDLYSLGVVLYEMLLGHVPYAGRDPIETLRCHVEEPPPLLDELPAGVRRVVERALAKRPEDRFASAAEMSAALAGSGE